MTDVMLGVPMAAVGIVMGLGIAGLAVLVALVVLLMLMPARWINP